MTSILAPGDVRLPLAGGEVHRLQGSENLSYNQVVSYSLCKPFLACSLPLELCVFSGPPQIHEQHRGHVGRTKRRKAHGLSI